MAGRTKKPAVKKKCVECGSANPKKHKETCPNWLCPECSKVANQLGHAQSCSKFKSFADESKRIRKGTVDGRDAVIDHTKRDPAPAEEPSKARAFPDVVLIDGALKALQSQMDSGDFSGEKQQKDECMYEYVEDGVEKKCAHVAVIPKMVKKVCPTCEHAHKETLMKFCIGHAINVFGGNDPARLQTEMEFAE